MMCSAIFFGKGRYFETATMSAPTFSLTCFYIVLVNLRRKLRNDENCLNTQCHKLQAQHLRLSYDYK